jgi:hypothetical protein
MHVWERSLAAAMIPSIRSRTLCAPRFSPSRPAADIFLKKIYRVSVNK